jgi:hypothetical protein
MQEDFFKQEKFGFSCFDYKVFLFKSLCYDASCDGIFLDFSRERDGFFKVV